MEAQQQKCALPHLSQVKETCSVRLLLLSGEWGSALQSGKRVKPSTIALQITRCTNLGFAECQRCSDMHVLVSGASPNTNSNNLFGKEDRRCPRAEEPGRVDRELVCSLECAADFGLPQCVACSTKILSAPQEVIGSTTVPGSETICPSLLYCTRAFC